MFIESAVEDYNASDSSHSILGERKTFSTDRTSRIVIPEYGALFVNTLKVYDGKTKAPLTRGRDYDVDLIDELATLRSGKEVAVSFSIKNNNILSIEFDYHFVGGMHSNGKYLISKLKKQYPEGIESEYKWENIIGKADTFPTKEHNHHAKDTYGYDEVIHQLQRMAVGIGKETPENIGVMLSISNGIINGLDQQADLDIESLKDKLDDSFLKLRTQDGEYIFTDSPQNPSIARGYGRWLPVQNTVIQAGANDIEVGNGTVLSIGGAIALRQVYVWKQMLSGRTPLWVLVSTSPEKNGQYHTTQENEIIRIGVQTAGVAPGTKVTWVLDDIDPLDVVEPFQQVSGEWVLDADARFLMPIKFKNNPNIAGNRIVKFRLDDVLVDPILLVVRDVTNTKNAKVWFTYDRDGKEVAPSISEGKPFYLQLELFNYVDGEDVVLDWSASTVLQDDVVGGFPTIIQASGSRMTIQLTLKDNTLTDGNRDLIVYYIGSLGNPINDKQSNARAVVRDTSMSNVVFITFTDLMGNLINSIPEGSEFDINIATSLSPGSGIGLSYSSSKDLSLFEGLIQTTVVGADGRAKIRVRTIEDFTTNIGVQTLNVVVTRGLDDVAVGELIIQDTSKDPNYDIRVTLKGSDASITEAAEGDEVTVRISIPNYTPTPFPIQLHLQYGLNKDYSNRDALLARVSGTFHDVLEFSGASAVYDDVSWNEANKELSIDFKIIEDNDFSDDADFTVGFNQANGGVFHEAPPVKILDTSILNLSSAWSSSAVELIPISSINEMNDDGTNKLVYLWLIAGGDGTKYGDITLSAAGTVNSAEDLVTVFPSTTRFTAGAMRHVFAVEIKADFFTEGDETLTVSGTYRTIRGELKTAFTTELLIIKDNSVRTPLTIEFSNYVDKIENIKPGDRFSENAPIYAHIKFTAIPFDTMIGWTLNVGTDQFVEVTGGVLTPAGATTATIRLNPVRDKIKDGEIDVIFDSTRTPVNSNVLLGLGSGAFGMLDDSIPTTVKVFLYTDAARTQLALRVDEGVQLYGRVIVDTPNDNCYVVVNITNENDTVIDGIRYKGYASGGVEHAYQGKVINSLSAVDTPQQYPTDFTINILADRKTSNEPQALRIGAMVYAVEGTPPAIGTSVSNAFNENVINSVYKVDINDTSKTGSINAVIVNSDGQTITSALEGTEFFIRMTVADGVVNDVYNLSRTNSFDVDRFEDSELNVDKFLQAVDGTVIWKMKVKIDRNTTTNNAIVFAITNKTTGQIVTTLNFTNLDKYFTPKLTVSPRIHVAATNTWTAFPNTVYEKYANVDVHYIKVTGDENLLEDDLITLHYVSGRPVNMWDSPNEWNGKEHSVGSLLGTVDDNPVEVGNKWGSLIFTKPTRNYVTDPVEHRTITGYIETKLSKVRVDFTWGINDSSRTRQVTSFGFKNRANEIVTSISEGEWVYPFIKMSGDNLPFELQLINDGGRPISMFSTNEYDVIKSRASDSTEVRWNFNISRDRTETETVETQRLKVKIRTVDGPLVEQAMEIPIINTSRDTRAEIFVYNKDQNFRDTVLIEDIAPIDLDVYVYVRNLGVNNKLRVRIHGNRPSFPGDDWERHVELAQDELVAQPNGSYLYKTTIRVVPNNTSIYGGALNVRAENTIDNFLLGNLGIVIVDMSRETYPEDYIRLHANDDASRTHLAAINEGNTYTVFIRQEWYTLTDWGVKRFDWKLVNEDNVNDVIASGSIVRNDVVTGGSGSDLTYRDYSKTVPIPANWQTDGNRNIRVILEEVYVPIGSDTSTFGYSKKRGQSAISTLVDSSPTPTIDAVYFSTENKADGTAVAVSTFDEGATMYVHVIGTGLSLGEDVVVDVGYGGEVTASDFDQAIPTKITMKMVNPTTRKFVGVSTAIRIKKDEVEG